MSPKFLNKTELDEYWNWYEGLLRDDDEVPELDEEQWEMICNIIEDLFQHSRHQQKVIAHLEGEVMGSLGALKKDVAEFKSRKRRRKASEPRMVKRAKGRVSRT